MEADARFIKFETELMGKLLEGDGDNLEILRRQYEAATVKTREFSGAGFFTTFYVPEKSTRLPREESLRLDGITGKINGVANGAGFVLFVKKGAIHLLEGYTYGDEHWPEILTEYKLVRLPQ
jgi:hypothetical protein